MEEEEEKEGLSMCEIVSWFETKGIHLNTEWLAATLSYLGRKATIKGVFEQFVFSHLEESYERPMKIPDRAAKIVLTKRIVFQIISVLNVARPIFDQLKDELRTDNNLTWFYGNEAEDDPNDEEETRRASNGRQCVMVTVSDGSTTLKAIDYGRVDGLTDELPIGTKLIIVDRVMCRRGVMVLKKTNCTILGGAFEADPNVLSKAERLSNMLSTSTRSKIEPYLSRVKKEFDLNQRTISPFLRRIPPKNKPSSPPPSLPPPLPLPSHLHQSIPLSSMSCDSIENTIVSPLSQTNNLHNTSSGICMPPPSIIPVRRCSLSQVQSILPSAPVVESTIKIEEIDSDFDTSVMLVQKEAPSTIYNKRSDDSFTTSSTVSHHRRVLPIIPSNVQMEVQSQAQTDPLDHSIDGPQRPCVKLTPQTLAERIEASQSKGRNKEIGKKLIQSSNAKPSKDVNRSIASYFHSSKGIESKWTKKTQMVEPSNRSEIDAMRKEIEEGMEEGRRKEEEEKIMREDQEMRERKEREEINMKDEEERRRIYYEQMRRRDNEDIRRREEEEERRRRYGVSNPQVSVVVVSTPTPCSYITPPSGYVTLPQSKQIHHHPLSHPSVVPSSSYIHSHQMEMPPLPMRNDSSNNNFLLFGEESRPSVPMNLFGSPARIHPSANHAVIPFKKTKTEEQKMKTEDMNVDGFRMNYGMNVDKMGQFNGNSTSDPFQSVQGVHGGVRSGYTTEFHYPHSSIYQTSAISMRPPMEISREGMTSGVGGISSEEKDVQTRYLSLNAVSLSDVMSKRKFWMMPKTFHVIPLYTMIDRNLNIEQGLWDMKMNVIDESGEEIICQLDHKLLEDLLGMSVDAARHMREANSTQFLKFKDRGTKMFKSMNRMDLVLDVEVSTLPKELPLITKIRTLPEVLSIV
ncbi:hypothetical protein PRIPAC_84388 [Pristionchus pacificus]|uniref:RecQ-mediated genome instability protein 1 n=1 Tax=Pristionchus pacificus TaxID=54126 RepID=A0A8R1YGP0_PRIPA|nr:hypothetical protein PRIPAC_84388 [Pristionchus pacificus]